jgi:uncharacterized protein YgiM (DUF1202 family)
MKFIGISKEYSSPGEGLRTALGVGLLLALAFISILGADAMFSNPRATTESTSLEASASGDGTDTSAVILPPTDPIPTDAIPTVGATDPSGSEPTDATAPSFTETSESATYYATGEINVRSGPGTDYDIVDTLEWGDKINVVAATDNDWKKIGESRYVTSDFITKIIPEKPMSGTFYAKGELNVRSGPGTDFSITKELTKGSAIEVVAITANDWYRTVKDTYVLASLCDDEKPLTPTPKPTSKPTPTKKPTPTPKPIPEGAAEQAALVNLSVDDFLLMAGIVEAECPTHMGYTAQTWGAQVIWNRVKSSRFAPNTVFGVISQGNGGQFSTYTAGEEEKIRGWATKSSRKAVVQAYWDFNPPIPDGVLFFDSRNLADPTPPGYYGSKGGNHYYYYK